MSSRLVAAVAAIVIAQPAAAQQAFEGVVKYRMTTGGRASDMTYMAKGERVRLEMEMEGIQAFVLLDLTANTMTTVMPSEEMYMRMDMSAGASRGGRDDMPKITATGRKETIAGRECEHYLIGDDESVDACVATGLGYYFGGGGGGRRGPGAQGGMSLPSSVDPRARQFRERFKDGFFPLKLTMMERGRVQSEMVVTSIERRTLSDNLFRVPEGYEEMRMPMMPGMGERP